MAGHSKWANIQHRKNRQDAKRGQLWTKLIREITVAARDGGADPGMNPRLRLSLEKASAGNVPKDTVNKAIQRGSGRLEGASYEEIRYEGYGIGGAAIIVDCLTDNRTRTVAEVRHALSKYGGNLGTDGSVAYQFRHCGQFVFAPGVAEDRVIEICLEAGADDVQSAEDRSIEVLCAPGDFDRVREAFLKAGLQPAVADITMKALNEIPLGGDEGQKMKRLLEALEDLDDVQHVYTSAAIEE
jgi:YebC/PmpR family DNA-binding regulatory protein